MILSKMLKCRFVVHFENEKFEVLDNNGIFDQKGRINVKKVTEQKQIFHLKYVGKCHYESLMTNE